jgi:hypothetical protein
MIDYAAILIAKYPSDEWTLDGTEYEGLTWLSDSPQPSKTTLDDLWVTVQAEAQTEKETKELQRLVILEKLGLSETELRMLF